MLSTSDFHDKINVLTEKPKFGGVQIRITFTNGWSASVIRHEGSYGGRNGLWEMAVINPEGDLDYANPITGDDVVGNLTEEKVVHKLSRLANLTTEQLTHYRKFKEYQQALARLGDIKGELQDLYEGITEVVHSDGELLPLELRVGFDLLDQTFQMIAVENPEIEEDVE